MSRLLRLVLLWSLVLLLVSCTQPAPPAQAKPPSLGAPVVQTRAMGLFAEYFPNSDFSGNKLTHLGWRAEQQSNHPPRHM